MLILTRRIGETIMIGDEISLTPLGIKGNQVRIGIQAPQEVEVHREEIYNKIHGKSEVERPQEPARTRRVRGFITFINLEKGFGFLTTKESDDIYFHASSVSGIEFASLEEGAHVQFNLQNGERGPVADDVMLLDEGSVRQESWNI